MSSVDIAAELKAIAKDFGLRTRDLHTTRPDAARYSIELDDGQESEKIYVQASPSMLAISHELTNATKPLTYEEALELMLDVIGG